MYDHVSKGLITKIKTDMLIEGGVRYTHSNNHVGLLRFQNNEYELYNECLRWMEIVKQLIKRDKYSNAYMLPKVGRFVGVRPYQQGKDMNLHKDDTLTIEFEVEEIDNTQSWKDWFVQDELDGTLTGVVGTVARKDR